MTKSIRLFMLALAATAGFSVHVQAQSPGCADVVWSAKLLENNPNIANHCLELIERGGEWYAKVQVKIVRHGANSTVVRYREPDGSWSSSERTYPPRGFKAEIGNQEVLISQTPEGQELNVYASSQGGENFNIPMLAGAAPHTVTTNMAEEVVMGDSDEEPAPTMLPSTAGQAGWLAILGTLLLVMSGVAHLVRNRS